jgi:hypothetical protein
MTAPDYDRVWAVVPAAKLDEATEKAGLAFWAAVAEFFPEVKTGDYPPELTFEFNVACERAIGWWLIFNHPQIQKAD